MNPEELKDRTKQFALRTLKLVAALPKTVELVAIMVASRKSAATNLRSAI